jgi:hypothetical protein
MYRDLHTKVKSGVGPNALHLRVAVALLRPDLDKLFELGHDGQRINAPLEC